MTTPHKAECRGYQAHQIPFIWDRVKPHIQKALNRGSNYTIKDIYEGLTNKTMQLWVWQGKPEIYGALVTTIQSKGDKTWCLFLVLGGTRMNEWIGLLPVIEDWARSQGCNEMRLYGRIGWAKVTGYDIEWTKMSKKL